MYIRQTSFLSFEEIIKFQQKTKLEMILSQIDVSKLSHLLRKNNYSRGPKGYDPICLIYALIAMQVERIPTVKDLVLNLKENPVLRYCCGFDIVGKTPSEATFSRFLDKLSEVDELHQLFRDLILKAKELGIVEGNSVAIDSTKLNAYETPKSKALIIDDGQSPNWGMKRDTNGNCIRWFGWKLHVIFDCKSELPLDILSTPANVYDSTVAISLIAQFSNRYKDVLNPKYYMMDSGYDSEDIYNYIRTQFNAAPVIAYNKRSNYAPPEGFDDDLHPICSAGYKLAYWGKDKDYLKFRCPHAVGKCNCPFGMNWCSNSDYGYTIKLNIKANPRLHTYPVRGTPLWQKYYNKRTSAERGFSRLKGYLNLDNIHSFGMKKAKTHALLNCIALVAGTIAASQSKSLSKVA